MAEIGRFCFFSFALNRQLVTLTRFTEADGRAKLTNSF